MNWSKIKTVIILLLLVVNIMLVYNLRIQYASTHLIDADTLSTVYELLAKSGVTIADGVLTEKKPDAKVYEGAFSFTHEEYYQNTAVHLAQISGDVTNQLTLHMITNGIRIMISGSGEVFEFNNSNIFAVKYTGGSAPESMESYAEAAVSRIEGGKYQAVHERGYKKLEKALRSFLLGQNDGENGIPSGEKSSEYPIDSMVERAYFDETMSRYVLYGSQYLDGLRISGCEFVCVIENGKVVYLDGVVIMAAVLYRYTVDLIDQVNILFDDKAYMDAQSLQAADSTETNPTETNPTESDTKSTLTALDCVYCLNWNSERTYFYLIPAWLLEYNGNVVRIRNAINGSIYIM